MPELLVLRHAKSDWGAPFSDDRFRPLNDRGRASAIAIGRFLTATGHSPDQAVTSPAVRARTTLDMAADAGAWGVRVAVDERLYGGGVADALTVVRDHGGSSERLILVGHEPTWSDLVAHVIGGGSIRMATGAVAAIDLPDWGAVGRGSGRLLWMVVPRLLTDLGIGT